MRNTKCNIIWKIIKYNIDKIFKLFTSSKSIKNLHIYKKNGYKEIKQEKGLGGIIFVYLEKIKSSN